MKKIGTILMTLLLTICALIPPAQQASAAISILPGDVNGDNNVTAADARLALRAAVGLEKIWTYTLRFELCDVNGDGSITAADARLILRAAVGLEKLVSHSDHTHLPGNWRAADPNTHVRECVICKAEMENESHQSDLISRGAQFHAPYCSKCGYLNTRANDIHRFANGVCTACGEKEFAFSGSDHTHIPDKWKAADSGGHVRECVICKAEMARESHNYRLIGTGSQYHAPYCSVCGYLNTRANDIHLFVNGVCTACGQVKN